ncbi:MAG TPA: carbohydrate kinase [Verrucomicrobiales bacterium]|nr:carbohydrate kinase [Verrucomicrobiales bacterium]
MNLKKTRARSIIKKAQKRKVLVVGDLMLDQFVWGSVHRISPEAPVPVVNFERESFMAGGAGNVARNLASLGVSCQLFGMVGRDAPARQLKLLLKDQNIDDSGLLTVSGRMTGVKTRIIAHQQQVVRLDRETLGEISLKFIHRLLDRVESCLDDVDAIIIGDYGKGVVCQEVLDRLKAVCRARGIWLSLDPKPTHDLDLTGLSLITPNRKEAFEMAGMEDLTRHPDPFQDTNLLETAKILIDRLNPALLLITLGETGMFLCRRNQNPMHIPTVAREVYDVSGAGDTVIASFTAAITGGAHPYEAAVLSNHASGLVVGKFGTATTSSDELIHSFDQSSLK